MKRNFVLFSLALSGASFSAGALQAQTSISDGPRSSVGRISDSSGSSGSRNIQSDSRPVEFRNNAVDPTLRGTNSYVNTNIRGYQDAPAPVPMADSAPMGHAGGNVSSMDQGGFSEYMSYGDSMGYSGCGDSCGGSCGGSCGCGDGCGCGDFCGSSGFGRRGLFQRSGRNGRLWAETGALLWFPSARQTPPLVALNTTTGGLPTLNDANTVVLAGGNQAIGNDMTLGYKYGLGMWLDDSREIGVGGRAFGFYNQGQDQNFNFDGNQSLGLPFYDTSLGAPNAYIVGIDSGVNGTLNGGVSLQNRLGLFGSELYIRRSLIRSGNGRIDFVGGYQYTHLNDRLNITSTYTDNIIGNGTTDGTVITRADRFQGVNEFHGGQLGTLSEFNRGKWNLSAGTKFGLGNMHQTVRVAGTTTTVTPAPANTTTTVDRGWFAQTSNIGNQSRNSFTFIPQIDLTLGYTLRRNIRAEVGYSMIVFTDVALAGSHVDTNIDSLNLGANPNAPARNFVTDSLVLHGLNLGLNWSF